MSNWKPSGTRWQDRARAVDVSRVGKAPMDRAGHPPNERQRQECEFVYWIVDAGDRTEALGEFYDAGFMCVLGG